MVRQTVAMHEYTIERQVESELGLRRWQTVCDGFKCPRCEHVNSELDHSEGGQCPECSLFFRLYGNGLECSDKFIPEHVGRDVQALRSIADRSTTMRQRGWSPPRWLGRLFLGL